MKTNDRSRFRAPPMPTCRSVDENGLAAMLAAKRSAGVTPEVNLRECVTCMPLPSMNKAAHSGFRTQRRDHLESQAGVSVDGKNDLRSPNFFKKDVMEINVRRSQKSP